VGVSVGWLRLSKIDLCLLKRYGSCGIMLKTRNCCGQYLRSTSILVDKRSPLPNGCHKFHCPFHSKIRSLCHSAPKSSGCYYSVKTPLRSQSQSEHTMYLWAMATFSWTMGGNVYLPKATVPGNQTDTHFPAVIAARCISFFRISVMWFKIHESFSHLLYLLAVMIYGSE